MGQTSKPAPPVLLMRDMTHEECDQLADTRRCVFCGGRLYEGPSAGIATNWICWGCGARYNLTPIKGFNWQIVNEPSRGRTR